VAGSYFFVSKKVFFGVFIGGVLSLLNIVVLSVIGEKVFKQKNPRKTLVIISYLIKIIILFGVLYFLISHEVINIFAFIAGFSIMILIIGFGIFFSSQHND
jgi:small-conductance mechanosensitive channel